MMPNEKENKIRISDIPKQYLDEFKTEMYKENLKREATFSLVLFVVALILLSIAGAEVCFAGKDRMSYVMIYSTLAVIMTITFFVTKYFAKREKNIIGKIVEVSFVILMGMFGVSLALSDVMLSHQVNAYVGAIMISGAIFYFNNIRTIFILIFSHTIFLIMLYRLLGEGVTYTGFVVNTTVMVLISFVLSRAAYYLYLKTFVAKVKLEEKSKELAVEKEKADSMNKLKSEFISNMSHEIRTPLNAILGFSELLKETIYSEKELSYLKGIISGGESLLNIINDILDMSKIEAGKMVIRCEPVDVKNIAYDIKHMFSYKTDKKNIDFLFEISENIPKILLIDEIRIRQILFNLVGNAIKFTKAGYVKVEIRSENNDDGKIKLIMIVEDTGIGIPQNQQERIFEAFLQQDGQSTRKYGGTGLGLTITKKLVELMGGKIFLESVAGKGSKFTVEIGDIDTGVVSEDYESIDSFNGNIIFEKKKILYAEDVETNRSVLKGFVGKFGFDIIEAENGLEAYEKAAKHKPDLILMDMHMPILDGIGALKLIKKDEETEKIPILLLTAQMYKDVDKDSISEFDEYIEKPINKRKLVEIFKKYIPHIEEGEMVGFERKNQFENIGMESSEIKDIKNIIEKNKNILVLEEMNTLACKITEIGNKYNNNGLKMLGLKMKNAYLANDIIGIEDVINILSKVMK